MTFQGGDPDGLRRLRRELQLAGVELARSRAAVDRTMNEVCMATTVPTELRRIEGWLDDLTAQVDRAALLLDEPRDPGHLTITGFPNGHEGDCDLMEEGIGANADALVRRFHDLREDVNNLRVLRPSGPFSFGGHVMQVRQTQKHTGKQLRSFDGYGCPESLTVAVARQYAAIDVYTELGWTAAAVAAAQAAARTTDRWWQVDVHVDPEALRTVAAGVAVAAGAVAAAARDLSTGQLAG